MKYLQYLVIAVVVASIAGGLYFAGSPQRARALRFDDRRLGDLQGLQSQILWYWQQEQRLPADLAALEKSPFSYVTPTDPETTQPYEYHATGALTFELCALFALPTPEDSTNRGYSYPYPQPYFEGTVDWKHGSGKTCYSRTIDKKQYDKDQAANAARKPVPVY